MNSIFKHIENLWKRNISRKNEEQLQQQQFLLRTGVPATARVLDMVMEDSEVSGYVQLHFWGMVKMQGSISYHHFKTLMNKAEIPSVGQEIRIRCIPEDLSTIVIV